MKLKKVKKGEYYFAETDITTNDGTVYTVIITDENKCETEEQLINELKRIEKDIKKIEKKEKREKPVKLKDEEVKTLDEKINNGSNL